MKQKNSLYLLCVSAVADVALYHPEISVDTVPLIFGFLVLYPVISVLYLRGQSCGAAPLPNGLSILLCVVYLVYSGLQVQFLTSMIWQSRVAAAALPILFLLAAGMIPVAEPSHLNNLGSMIFGIAAVGCFIFVAANASNMHAAYLTSYPLEAIWTNRLARCMALTLPIPELLCVGFPAKEQRTKNTLSLVAFACAAKIAARLAGELTFGSGNENGIYQAAQLGKMFAIERLETVQVIVWTLMLYLRLRLLFCVIRRRNMAGGRRFRGVALAITAYLFVLFCHIPVEFVQKLLAGLCWILLTMQVIGGCRIWKKKFYGQS